MPEKKSCDEVQKHFYLTSPYWTKKGPTLTPSLPHSRVVFFQIWTYLHFSPSSLLSTYGTATVNLKWGLVLLKDCQVLPLCHSRKCPYPTSQKVIGNSVEVGGFQNPKFWKKSVKQKWNFQRGGVGFKPINLLWGRYGYVLTTYLHGSCKHITVVLYFSFKLTCKM